jgi:hypothetical protein
VLTDLGLPRESLLIALVAFNLGVELGQLVIVSAFLPIAFALRTTALYQRVIVVFGSWRSRRRRPMAHRARVRREMTVLSAGPTRNESGQPSFAQRSIAPRLR